MKNAKQSPAAFDPSLEGMSWDDPYALVRQILGDAVDVEQLDLSRLTVPKLRAALISWREQSILSPSVQPRAFVQVLESALQSQRRSTYLSPGPKTPEESAQHLQALPEAADGGVVDAIPGRIDDQQPPAAHTSTRASTITDTDAHRAASSASADEVLAEARYLAPRQLIWDSLAVHHYGSAQSVGETIAPLLAPRRSGVLIEHPPLAFLPEVLWILTTRGIALLEPLSLHAGLTGSRARLEQCKTFLTRLMGVLGFDYPVSLLVFVGEEVVNDRPGEGPVLLVSRAGIIQTLDSLETPVQGDHLSLLVETLSPNAGRSVCRESNFPSTPAEVCPPLPPETMQLLQGMYGSIADGPNVATTTPTLTLSQLLARSTQIFLRGENGRLRKRSVLFFLGLVLGVASIFIPRPPAVHIAQKRKQTAHYLEEVRSNLQVAAVFQGRYYGVAVQGEERILFILEMENDFNVTTGKFTYKSRTFRFRAPLDNYGEVIGSRVQLRLAVSGDTMLTKGKQITLSNGRIGANSVAGGVLIAGSTPDGPWAIARKPLPSWGWNLKKFH